jgi:endogenous inhibitor of DNA gyrase (YacG/DUF329 family)
MGDDEAAADCPACGEEVGWSEWLAGEGGSAGECVCPHCGHETHVDEIFPM